jgi:hypothetical protein
MLARHLGSRAAGAGQRGAKARVAAFVGSGCATIAAAAACDVIAICDASVIRAR